MRSTTRRSDWRQNNEKVGNDNHVVGLRGRTVGHKRFAGIRLVCQPAHRDPAITSANLPRATAIATFGHHLSRPRHQWRGHAHRFIIAAPTVLISGGEDNVQPLEGEETAPALYRMRSHCSARPELQQTVRCGRFIAGADGVAKPTLCLSVAANEMLERENAYHTFPFIIHL